MEAYLDWPTHLRRRVMPRRRDGKPEGVMPKLDREVLFDRCAKAYRKKRRSKGAAGGVLARNAHEKYTARKEPTTKRLSPDNEAVAALLAGLPDAAATSTLASDFVGYWWIADGPPFVLKTLFRMWSFRLDLYDDAVRKEKDRRDLFWREPDRFGPWAVLRRYLAASDQASYDVGTEEADRMRASTRDMPPQLALRIRAATSFLFPTKVDWVDEDVALFLKLHGQSDISYWKRHGYCLLAATTKREHLEAMVKRSTNINATRKQDWLAFLPNVVDSLGPDAFELLKNAADEAYYNPVPKACAEAISAIVSPDVASWFTRKLVDASLPNANDRERKNAKVVAIVATDYLKRHAAIGLPALQAVVSKKSTSKKALSRLLSSLEAERGAPVKTLREKRESPPEAPVLPKALVSVWKTLPKKKLPSFWSKDALPPLVLQDGRALQSVVSDGLGKALMVSTPSKPHAAVVAVMKACDPDAVSDWALAVFDGWLEAGAPSAHKWALLGLAHLGGDAAARRLAPLMIRWPSEGGYARARLALDVLSRIDTDVGNLYFERVWERATTETFRKNLAAARKARAAARRVSTRELTDRMPDFGLDAKGRRRLDYGPRAFHVGFDRHLKPFVQDDEGARLRRLPSPRTSDDALLAARASRVWEAMKTDAEVLASLQLRRFEEAMCRGWSGSWSKHAFEKRIVAHPLLGPIARDLLWDTRSKKGKTLGRFRVTSDGSFADVHDKAMTVSTTADVHLQHPLEVEESELSAWRSLFAEYEIIQPFPQLLRKVFPPTAEEAKAKSLGRVEGKTTTMAKIRALFRYGWGGEDSYSTFDFESLDDIYAVHISRPIRGTPYRVTIRVDETGRFGSADLVEGTHWGYLKYHRFGALHPIVFSEIVRELVSAT